MPRGKAHEVTINHALREGFADLSICEMRATPGRATPGPTVVIAATAYAKGADPIRSARQVVVADIEAHLRQKSENL